MALDADGQRTPGCTCAYCVDAVFTKDLSVDPLTPWRLEVLPQLDGMTALRTVSPVQVCIYALPPDDARALASALAGPVS
jgi:hypothetical protein